MWEMRMGTQYIIRDISRYKCRDMKILKSFVYARKSLIVGLLLFCVQSVFSACVGGDVEIDDDTLYLEGIPSTLVDVAEDKDGYKHWQRYKVTKRWAWAMASVGGVAALTGIVGKTIDKSVNDNYSSESSRHWNIPTFAGLGIAASSVPLFVFAEKEKKSAVQPMYEKTKCWKKHNVFKTWAWTTLGVGIAATGVGYVGRTFGFGEKTYSRARLRAYRAMWVSGGVLIAGSVPLFILSKKEKYKAKGSVLDVSLNATSVQDVNALGHTCGQPALGLSFCF